MSDSHPERDHWIVAMVVIPNTTPLRLGYKVPEDGVEFLVCAGDQLCTELMDIFSLYSL